MLPSLISESGKDKGFKSNLRDESLVNYFSSFPEESLIKKFFKNAFIINRPMSGVGGDGYWLYYEEDIGLVYVIVYDCMGHGRLASIMTRIYLNAIKEVVETKKVRDPAEILTEIHATIGRNFKDKQDKQVGSGADMGVLKFDTNNRKVLFAGAKMDLVHISGNMVNRIKADKKQLGVLFDYKHDYHTNDIAIPETKTSNFYLFSDGVTDLIGGPNDKKLKFSNLLEILKGVQKIPIEGQKQAIEKEFNNWAGHNTQLDDLLMIGISF
ncbi:MAG TPA: PP2C family protein-serine/threonine phosphatase [Cyclobacteriaceae bacterium]